MESASIAAPAGASGAGPEAREGSKGLKAGALGYLSNLVIGVASTAPGYSLAATLGFITAVVAFHAPAVMLISFVPMLLIAASYYYFNKADPDCGTSFTWVTRAMGPRLGWLTGWAIVAADVVVMAALAYIAGRYSFLLFGLDDAANNLLDISIVAAIWIVVMTWICWRGIELSARIQYFLLAAEIAALLLFAVVALVKVYSGDALSGGAHVSLDWFNPLGIPGGFGGLADGVLLGVFIYWGWDSGVCVNEESDNTSNGPGRAAVMSTIVLVLIYVVVATAAVAFAGPGFSTHNADDVLSALGSPVLGSPLDKLLIIAVLTSASASTQTTILPTARTTLSMARFGSIPKAFGRIHPRYLTPDVSTIVMGAVSLAWTLFIINASQNVLSDSITGIGFLIAFYYGLTGFACTIYFRKELLKSPKNFIMGGIAPFLGGAMLTGVFIKAYIDYKPADANYGGDFLGFGLAVAIGVGLLVVGVALLVIANFVYPDFFKRKWETAEPGILEGEVTGEASVMAD
jgi:amino acid transporter